MSDWERDPIDVLDEMIRETISIGQHVLDNEESYNALRSQRRHRLAFLGPSQFNHSISRALSGTIGQRIELLQEVKSRLMEERSMELERGGKVLLTPPDDKDTVQS